MPLSSGIPYLIYSSKENAPIGAGSYPSAPNDYVLYTQQANSSSIFGFSWDFGLNTNKDGLFIENQDLIGSGAGGSWDIFWYVLTINNGEIRFNKQNNSISQQFNIIPNDYFRVTNIETTIDGAEIISSTPTVLRTGEAINETSNPVTASISINESKTNSSSFTETSGLTIRHSGNANVSFSLFGIIKVGGGYTFDSTTQSTQQYGTTSSRTISFIETYNITIPPNRRAVYEYIAMEHLVNIPYIATMKGQGSFNPKILNLNGIYSGVEYSTTSIRVTEYPIGEGGLNKAPKPIRTYTISSGLSFHSELSPE